MAFPLTASAQDITTGLVGHWKMDETAGTTATNAIGNNASMQGGMDATSDSVPAKVETGLDFDGNDYMTVTDATLDLAGSLTVAAWVNMRSFGSDLGGGVYVANIIDMTNGANGYGVGMTEAAGDNGIWIYSSSAGNIYSDLNLLSLNEWIHVTITVSGGTVTFYLDGQQIGTDSFNLIAGGGSVARIGTNSGSSEFFDGAMDDLRVYNRALTPADIQELYQSKTSNMRFNTNARVAEYYNGTQWIPGGPQQHVPNAVHFDGTNDYLLRGGALTGVTDGKQITASFWARFNNYPSATYTILQSNPSTFSIVYAGGGTETMQIILRDSGTVVRASIGCGPDPHVVGTWYHHLISVDAESGETHCYVDDADSKQIFTAPTDVTLDFTPSEVAIGASGGGSSRIDGQIADLWIDFNNYIDFSIEANRRKFIDADGKPVYLGADGSRPTGTAPEIFLSGPTDTWHQNDGTGGGFTETGTISTGASPAVCYGTGPFNVEDTDNTYGWSQDVWTDGNYIYSVDLSNDFTAYSFNGSAFTELDNYTSTGDPTGVWGDGTYVYLADGVGGIKAFSFDGVSFTGPIDTYDTPGVARQIHGDGTYIYVADETGGVHALTFDGTSFTYIDTLAPAGVDVNDVYADGQYVFIAGNEGGTSALTFDGISFSSVNTLAVTTHVSKGVWGDGEYLYIAEGTAGMHAASFDGSTITILDTRDTANALDGFVTDHLTILVDRTNGLFPFFFDGTTLGQVADNINMPGGNDTAASFDGTYIYGAVGGGGFHAISGFNDCKCANPERPEGTVIYNTTSDVLQFCDGENWQAMGPVPGAGGPGPCASPAGTAGKVIFNNTSKWLQYCDGTNWIQIGGAGSVAPTYGLVGWWSLDELSNPLEDSIGTNDGTGAGGITYGSVGKLGNAVTLDGIDGVITHGLELPKPTGTIAHWLKPQNASDMMAMYESSCTNGNCDGFGVTADELEIHTGIVYGKWTILYQDGGNAASFKQSRVENLGPDVDPGVWTHVVATWDHSDELKLYVNGTLVGSDNMADNTFNGNTALERKFGETGNGHGGRYWNGEADDIRVYNRVLSADEVRDLYLGTGGTK